MAIRNHHVSGQASEKGPELLWYWHSPWKIRVERGVPSAAPRQALWSLYLEYESYVFGFRDNLEKKISLWCSSNTLASRGWLFFWRCVYSENRLRFAEARKYFPAGQKSSWSGCKPQLQHHDLDTFMTMVQHPVSLWDSSVRKQWFRSYRCETCSLERSTWVAKEIKMSV